MDFNSTPNLFETMMEQMNRFTEDTLLDLSKVTKMEQLEHLRVQHLGKKGQIALLMQQLKHVDPKQKPQLGAQINKCKQTLLEAFSQQKQIIEDQLLTDRLKKEAIDITLPGRRNHLGSIHPITLTIERITHYFVQMGFNVEYGPEIEDDYHNFEALNIPAHHPARAMHDTFYINPNTLLRTHTSPVQIRAMKKDKPPLAIICPGKVYRCDSDQTHSPMFHQIEALYVAKQVNFAQLKTFISDFLKAFFDKEKLNIRFRPSYFPFTEPSAEVDIEWGQNSDGSTKWLEVLGCGMVHPKVLQNVDIDSENYKGFALGLGVERFAMLQYGVEDLRQFFENDLNFLNQFK